MHTARYPRLKEYPRGLGKGFDAALVGSWLGDFVEPLGDDAVPVARIAWNILAFTSWLLNMRHVFLS